MKKKTQSGNKTDKIRNFRVEITSPGWPYYKHIETKLILDTFEGPLGKKLHGRTIETANRERYGIGEKFPDYLEKKTFSTGVHYGIHGAIKYMLNDKDLVISSIYHEIRPLNSPFDIYLGQYGADRSLITWNGVEVISGIDINRPIDSQDLGVYSCYFNARYKKPYLIKFVEINPYWK